MSGQITLRPAGLDDVPTLRAWDREPHVIAATTDDDVAEAHEDTTWEQELTAGDPASEYLIAELDGRPVEVLQIIDPAAERTRYWGAIEGGLRAIDIWIGPPDCLGRGYGATMMGLALARCFEVPEVHAVVIDPLASNVRAHRFYQRMGFRPVERRWFGDDDTLVHRLDRADWSG